MWSSPARVPFAGLAIALALGACGSDSDKPAKEGDMSGVSVGDAGAPDAGDQLPWDPLSWEWKDVPGTLCQDDKESGVFVHEGTVNRLVLYFEGGGACFNEFLCGGNPQSFGAADERRAQQVAVLNDSEKTPFADYHKVFLGYCSGDVFSGASTNHTGYGNRTQQGYLNVGKVLEAVLPKYKDVDLVAVVGSSAGGFGAAYNWGRIQEAFGEVPVYLIDDAGPPMRNEYVTPCLQTILSDTWSWSKTLPVDCTDCAIGEENAGISRIFPYYFDTYPDRRFALMSTTRDGTIQNFFAFGQDNCDGLPYLPPERFEAGLFDLRDSLSPYDNFVSWITPGTSHTYLIGGDLDSENGGVKMGDWLEAVIEGGSNFKTVGPEGPTP